MCTGMPFEIDCSVDLLSVMGSGIYQWTITVPSDDNLQGQFERTFSPTNNSMIRALELDLTTLNFSSRSFQHQVLSTVFTDNATADLNGTVLSCYWQLNKSVNRSDRVKIVMVGDDTCNVNSKLLRKT